MSTGRLLSKKIGIPKKYTSLPSLPCFRVTYLFSLARYVEVFSIIPDSLWWSADKRNLPMSVLAFDELSVALGFAADFGLSDFTNSKEKQKKPSAEDDFEDLFGGKQ